MDTVSIFRGSKPYGPECVFKWNGRRERERDREREGEREKGGEREGGRERESERGRTLAEKFRNKPLLTNYIEHNSAWEINVFSAI